MTSIHTNKTNDLENNNIEKSHQDDYEPFYKPHFDLRSISKYLKTRFTDLAPSKEFMLQNKHLLNPIPALKEIPAHQWNYIVIAFLAWCADALDFFSVVMNVDALSKDLNTSTTNITWGTTVVLMLRSVGAFIFGYFSDKYGSKWPLVINILLMTCIQIGFSFIQTYSQFLAVRALFGIVMGGIYGNAVSTALDDCPPRARGVISGLLQQGYATGYLIAVVFTRAIADTQSHTWRAMYWVEAGITFIIAISRTILPQTNLTRERILESKLQQSNGVVTEPFNRKFVRIMKDYWLMFVYLILLMSGFNFMSHGSQDLYPTFLKVQLGFSNDRATVTNCVANIGAIAGGLIVGHFSVFVGSRLIGVSCCILSYAVVYSWSHYTGSIGSLNAAAFFLQFFAQGCFAIVPSFLNSLADPELKSFIVGMSYQLGNLASSASSTIESTIGARFPLNINGKHVFDYGKVLLIFMCCVYAYLFLVLLLGPERKTIEQDIQEEKELNDFYDNKFSETNDVQQIEQSEKNEVTVNNSTKKN